MRGSFRIATIAGIAIDINFSWFIIFILLAVTLANGQFPAALPGKSYALYLLLGAITAILLFASVLLHELAHALVARMRGIEVHTIELYIFGGVSNLEREPPTPAATFLISIVGPLTSLVVGGICIVLVGPAMALSTPLGIIVEYLGITNIVLGVFNLLPGLPLDGGQVLRAIIWAATHNQQRATRVTALVGQILAFIFIFIGILEVFNGLVFDGIWIGLIGWFFLQAAQNSNTRMALQTVFRGVKVSRVMSPAPPTIEANRTIEQLVAGVILQQSQRTVLVTRMHSLAGQVTLIHLRQVPREQWGQTMVGEVMTPIEQLHVLNPDQYLLDVLPFLAEHEGDHLPVLAADGQLVGVLDREAIVRYLQLHQMLGPVVESAPSTQGSGMPERQGVSAPRATTPPPSSVG